MAMETFPLPYLFDVDKDTTFATRSIIFESQRKQVQQLAVNPMIQWKIQCKGSIDDLDTLEAFHHRMAGNTKVFYFTDDRLVQRKVRFAEPKLSRKLIREFSTTNVTHGIVVGFVADIVLEVAL